VVSTDEMFMPKKSFRERMEECSTHFGQNYFDEMVKKGCDYKAFGDWQKGYCGLLDRVFGIRGKEVLDVGSAYGALGNGFKQLGAKEVTCVDISKQAIATKRFDGLVYVLAPVQLMKAVQSGSQDLIHASYLMNSVDAEDLDITFFELKRVLAAKGKVFIIMNFGKDQKVSDFDTRHSKETIVKAANKAGFKEVTEIVNQLRSVDDGRYEFISNYNWGIVCFE
jgi:predicted RNA methylase